MKKSNITQTISSFKNTLAPTDRSASFDYCYNYFSTTDDLTKEMERSCLTLGLYLASWGMYRGSSFILQKSVKHYQPTIEYLNELDKSYWSIDIDKYDEANMAKILEVYSKVKGKLIPKNHTHLTLTTKVLLGVFGFVPAYDRFFRNTFKQIFNGECGFSVMNKESLLCLKKFYDTNQIEIDTLANETFTIDFLTEKKTSINYSKAKIIDMYGLQKGKTNN